MAADFLFSFFWLSTFSALPWYNNLKLEERSSRMRHIQNIELRSNHEELLPGFSPDFPYISTCAELDQYTTPATPWHWHRTVELFYVQSGHLQYTTPGGSWDFPAGSGGFINSNVLHSSAFPQRAHRNVQLLHLFDPVFLSGSHGNRLESKYILPLVTSGVEIIPLFPEDQAQRKILETICAAFSLEEHHWGYELKLRQLLTDIWLALLAQAQPRLEYAHPKPQDGQIKTLMIYLHEHYSQPISVEELSTACNISKRTCYRLFHDQLHTSPTAYLRCYRLQIASQMLCQTNESITQIAYQSGLGSSSYFGKLFREQYHCTPLEYRQHWHDRDKSRQ